MSDQEWESVALGEVLTQNRDRVRVEPGQSYSIAGVLIAGAGVFHRETIDGADTKYEHLHRIHMGQVVYRKLTAWEGPITIVPPEFDGAFLSPEFPTFTIDQSRLLPRFVRLICQHPAFHYEMRLMSTGTAERRSRLNPSDLLEIEIDLPSLREQEAIADAVGRLEQLENALGEEQRSIERMLRGVHADLDARDISEEEFDSVLVRIEAGKSPKCLDRRPVNGEWGVLKVSAIREGRFVPLEAKALPPTIAPFKRAQVCEGDLLVSRANTPNLVGAACLVADQHDHLLLCDKTLRLVVDDERADAGYLVEALALPSVREQIVLEATGSSDSMKNISQETLRRILIPLPPLEAQRAVAKTCSGLRNSLASIIDERTTANELKAAVRDELLTGVRRLRD